MGARSSETAPRIVRFGVFEVDFVAGELRKLGHQLKLEALPFRVLTLLVGRPGELVTREELQRELWPDGTFVEFDDGLNTAVKKLRNALGDSPRDSRFIETAPRQGYRFIAPVGQAAQALEQVHTESSAQPASRRTRLWALASVLVAGIVAVAVWYLVRSAGAPEASLKAVPLTFYPGAEWQPTFSPDGAQVAFVWDGETRDNFDIYVKVVGEEKTVRLTTDPNQDGSPAWSPNGRSIAFTHDLVDGRVGVFLVSPQGGSERRVAVVDSDVNPKTGPHLAWTPDGKGLVVPDKASAEEPLGLFLLSIETGEKQRLTRPPAGLWGDSGPAFSPDAGRLAFCRYAGESGNGDLYLLQLTGDFRAQGEAQRITFDGRYIGSPAWTAGGKEIIFAAGFQHSHSLHRMAASASGKPRPLSFAGPYTGTPAVSGGRLAFRRGALDVNFYRLDLEGPEGRVGEPVRLSSSTLVDHMPQYSPDGERIAFVSNRSDSPEIWVSDKDGRGSVQLTFLGMRSVDFPSWSPDGTRIVFSASRPAGDGIYEIGSFGDGLRQLDTGRTGGAPSWSRNGDWIFFDSDSTGRREVWRIPAAAGSQAVQVTRNGGSHTRESPDGRSLYYLKPKRTGEFAIESLWRAALSPDGRAGKETLLVDSIWAGNFAVLEHGVYFTPKDGFSIQFLDFATGKIRKIFQLPSRAMWGFSVSPGGRSILYTLASLESDLMLVENFR